MKPDKETEKPSDTYESLPSESQQPFDSSQTEQEDCLEYSEESDEPSPAFQEAVNPAHPHQCRD